MSTTDSQFATIFLACSREKLVGEYWPASRRALSHVVEQVWWRPNSASTASQSVLHLNGNVTQWLVTAFNKSEDKRDRPAEFAAEGGSRCPVARDPWRHNRRGEKTLQRLTAEELLAPYEFRDTI